MDIFEVYGKAIDDIQTIHRSRLLTQVLLSLRGNKKTLTQIREVTGSTSQAIIPRIRILESQQLIESTDHEYYLTPLGKIVTSKIADYIMTMGGIRQHRYFWAKLRFSCSNSSSGKPSSSASRSERAHISQNRTSPLARSSRLTRPRLN